MKTLSHEFVEFIPEILKEYILYISIKYRTASHLCPCGCKNKVVTPISPTRWELIFNGKSISLLPSISNSSFDCNSHYWIKRNEVVWSRKLSKEDIEDARNTENWQQNRYHQGLSYRNGDWIDKIMKESDQDHKDGDNVE